MAVKYVCRHCAASMGEIDNPQVNELQLGFHFLTPEERGDIITYNQSGDVLVKLTCDYCRKALDEHPELNLVASPLQ
ncbi:anti-sigma-F factor Fin family protein [Paenibacillus hodogayensis]|uniref:Anti-sigma-F factor Fin family protein n=1 Tax=Paenibacillus hodogayensis TaxID=279208 RepID=A0ABV5W5R6_9BACL